MRTATYQNTGMHPCEGICFDGLYQKHHSTYQKHGLYQIHLALIKISLQLTSQSCTLAGVAENVAEDGAVALAGARSAAPGSAPAACRRRPAQR